MRPGGKVPESSAQVKGGLPPEVAKVSEKFVPAAPLGGDVAVVMTSAGATIKTSALEAEVEALSVTITVKLYVPTVVGVPLRNPLLASSVNPGGSWLPGATNHR